MNKKIFAGLVILMGVSILGIIVVQLVWMNNAVKVKNELFDRSVNEALNKTVDRLEDLHDISVFGNMAFGDSINWISNEDYNFSFLPHAPKRIPVPDSLKRLKRPARLIRQIQPGNNNAIIELKVESDNDSDYNYNYHYKINSGGDRKNRNVIVLDTENIKQNGAVIAKTDTIVIDIDSAFEKGLMQIDTLVTKLDTFGIFMPEISSRLHVRTERIKRTADQFFNEIVELDNREINLEQIGELLTDELQNRNIPIDYKYGVLQDSLFVDRINSADSVNLLNSPFQVNLYPNDIFQKNIRLAITFPGRERFIYRSLNWLLIVSFLFSLIILLTFSLSIYYILKQKKISEMKSDFINNMTHEFKTPIATISVATDSIVNDKVVGNPEKIKYFAGMIKKENTRMNRQVEDILTIARLDKKEFEFNWETMNVHELIEDAILGIGIQVEKRNGIIEKELNAVNPVVTTDKMHFTNVVFNLLDNAIKYSVDAPKIKVSSVNKQGGILITVTDNGIGMNKTVQSKIFERFYRQSGGNIHNVKGFGLGLSYVKAVVEANQGNITVESESGKGSKFNVFLPFVRK